LYPTKNKKKVMLLANGLGMRDPTVFSPITTFYGSEYVYVTWYYRGLYGSGTPHRARNLSIQQHAADAVEVLAACGYDKANVAVGFSMGTAISLELAVAYPDKIDTIILINGFHGHVCRYAFQPLVRIPLVADCVELFLHFLLANNHMIELYRRNVLTPFVKLITIPLYASAVQVSPLLVSQSRI
jgi:pimeloyl-ACP methyl ester carboxylesterase